MKKILAIAVTSLAAASVAAAAPASKPAPKPAPAAAKPAPTAAKSAPTAPKPKISMAKARAIALKLAPGRVRSSEYEKEGGGWRYSFDIQQKNHIQEIGIDGQTGRVVQNKSEGKHDKE